MCACADGNHEAIRRSVCLFVQDGQIVANPISAKESYEINYPSCPGQEKRGEKEKRIATPMSVYCATHLGKIELVGRTEIDFAFAKERERE